LAKSVKKKKLRKSSDLSNIEGIIKNFEKLASTELLDDCSLSLPVDGGLSIDYYGSGFSMPDENFCKYVRIFYTNCFSIRLEFRYDDDDDPRFTKDIHEEYADKLFVAALIVNFLEKGEYGS
jgi:hypothetical protein